MSPDSFDQLKQARAFYFTDWHPFISTLYVYVSDRLFNSPIGVSIANTCIFIFFLALVITTFKSNIKILIVILGFYCAMPVYYMYNISLWKDVPYSYFFAIGLVYLYRLIVNNKLNDLISFLVCMFLASLFRHNGITVVVASILAVSLITRIAVKLKLVSITILVIGMMVVRVLLVSTLPGAKTPIIINQSNFFVILLGHMASLPHNGDKELIGELKALSPVIAPEVLAASYYPGHITTLLFAPNIGLDHNKVVMNKRLIVTTFIKLSIKYPVLMIKSIMIHGSLLWSPITLEKLGYYVVERGGNVCLKGAKAFSQYKCDEYKAQHIRYENYIPGALEKIDLFIDKYSPIFYMRPAVYVLFIAASVIAFARRKKRVWQMAIILLLPVIAQTLTMFIFVQAQDFRYHYGVVTIAPIFILMMYELSKKNNSSATI